MTVRLSARIDGPVVVVGVYVDDHGRHAGDLRLSPHEWDQLLLDVDATAVMFNGAPLELRVPSRAMLQADLAVRVTNDARAHTAKEALQDRLRVANERLEQVTGELDEVREEATRLAGERDDAVRRATIDRTEAAELRATNDDLAEQVARLQAAALGGPSEILAGANGGGEVLGAFLVTLGYPYDVQFPGVEIPLEVDAYVVRQHHAAEPEYPLAAILQGCAEEGGWDRAKMERVGRQLGLRPRQMV